MTELSFGIRRWRFQRTGTSIGTGISGGSAQCCHLFLFVLAAAMILPIFLGRSNEILDVHVIRRARTLGFDGMLRFQVDRQRAGRSKHVLVTRMIATRRQVVFFRGHHVVVRFVEVIQYFWTRRYWITVTSLSVKVFDWVGSGWNPAQTCKKNVVKKKN